MVEYVFLHFEANYGYLWKGQSANEKVILARKERWEAALAGLKKIDIKRGLDWCSQNSEHIPTPAEFRKHCLPSAVELGLPVPEEAYHLALCRQWQHKAVYHTWRNLDREIWRNSKPDTARKIFFDEYQKTIEVVRNGGELTKVPVASLPEPPRTEEQLERSRAIAKECIENLKKQTENLNQEKALTLKKEQDNKEAEFAKRAKATKEIELDLLSHFKNISQKPLIAA